MTKVNYTEKIERYFDCPKCGILISDDNTNGQSEEIYSGKKIICENCKKVIIIGNEE